MKTILTLICALAAAQVATAQTISVKGSDTLGAKLIPQIAEKYKAEGHASTRFEIAAEGSSTAFPALANGTAHIGMSSRRAKDEEITDCKAKGVTLEEFPICFDMLCVVVNKRSPLNNLTKVQVAKIFTGQVKDWSEVGGTPGPISIYTRNTSSGTYKDWQTLAMNGRDYPATSLKMAGNEQIAQEVARNKGGIGYVGLAYAKTRGLKAIKIDGVVPAAQNKRTYVYSRECYLYVPANAKEETKAFVQFIFTPIGQALVESTGFIHFN